MAEREDQLKRFLIKMKEESEKISLKLNIQKTKIMASCPIISWQIDGETMKQWIFLGSKVTADGDCSHGIKSHLMMSFSFSISPSNEYSGLISFRIDWRLDLLAVHGTLKSLLQQHSSKASILRRSTSWGSLQWGSNCSITTCINWHLSSIEFFLHSLKKNQWRRFL